MSFAGLRVLAFESRRSTEIAELIRRQGGDPIIAPALREAPLESNQEAFRFAERLYAGGFDMMIFMTGVGTRALNKVLDSPRFVEALHRVTVVARGPKPVAALRELDVPIAVRVPEPNTWRELLTAIEGRPERRIAIQEYGRPNAELVAALESRGCEVTPVQLYQYALPEDVEPLRSAVRELAAGRIDVALFTTAVQVLHLAQVAREAGCESEMLAGLKKAFIGSIGPTTNEGLEEFGIVPALTPTHPKMGLLVKEAADAR